MSGQGRCGWTLLAQILGDEISLHLQGDSPRLGPASAAWLALLAHRLRDRSRAKGALSVPGGSVALEAVMEQAGLRLHWQERDGPQGDPGPGVPRLLAPRGMSTARDGDGSRLSLRIRIPAAALEE